MMAEEVISDGAHAPPGKPISECVHVDLEVDPEINYSLLHNNRELLNTLTLTKLVDEP
jgi:hypothetical protein